MTSAGKQTYQKDSKVDKDRTGDKKKYNEMLRQATE